MSDPFLAEIRMFAGNFAPTGWALCNGQIMSISQNTALFSLLGTTYGGDGKSNFALPNLQASAPLAAGQGVGLSQVFLGESAGESTVTLLSTELPAHTHFVSASTAAGGSTPAGNVWSKPNERGADGYAGALGTQQAMSATALASAGSGQPHNNLMPYVVVTFIIALQGIFPARN
jgi:microcystin-dependent protein